MKRYDVIGIGNALMDFLIEIDNDDLLEMDLKKGELHLIDEKKSKEILKRLEKYGVKKAPGGSSANTLAGIGVLGGKAIFTGKIGEDEHGEIYEQKTIEDGVYSKLSRHGSAMTGHAITFITPDLERTFAVHLGAAVMLRKEDIFEEDIKASKILHIEGYQLEDAGLREVALHAMEIAKKSEVKISIDLSDPGIIRRNLKDLRKVVEGYANIVFVNEHEAKEFTGLEPEEALHEIAKLCEIAVVKLGEKGSLIKANNMVYRIPAYKVDVVNTNGAGDMYAAAILYGISKNMDIERAGRIGAYAASKVVSRVSARLNKRSLNNLEKEI